MAKNNNITSNLFNLIGNTPLVELSKISNNPHVRLLSKLELYNPSASIKDRIVWHIINTAEKTGQLKTGTTIVEASSGNTASSLAMIAAILNYKTIITLPDNTSKEKITCCLAYGATVIKCPANAKPDSSEYYVNKAKIIAQNIKSSFMLNQYENEQNIEAHYLTTGPEIWRQTAGRIDYLVAAASTGGTVSGISKYLKEKNPHIKVIVADPPGSIFYEYSKSKRIIHNSQRTAIEGMGKKYIPNCMKFNYIDEVIKITDEDSFANCKKLALTEGILAGGSSGAALTAALQISKNIKKDKVLVVIFPDSGLKYMSKIFNQQHAHTQQNIKIYCSNESL